MLNVLLSWRRAVRGIEKDLADSDPRLQALFSTFTLFTRDAQRPRAERLLSGPAGVLALVWRTVRLHWPVVSWRRLRWVVLCAAALAALVCTAAVTGAGSAPGRLCPVAAYHYGWQQHGPARCVPDWYGK